MNIKYLSQILIGSILLITACGPQRRARKVPRKSRQDYILKYQDLAIKEMNRSGVPASITMAQAMLESDNGNSYLAREAKNHFGIKCHKNWSGPKIHHDDNEKNECFRKYNQVYESYKDHSDFLMSNQRYDFLFKLKKTDYKAWAQGLKKAGYATDEDYAELLINIIEDNKLYKLDQGKTIKSFHADKEQQRSADSGTKDKATQKEVQQKEREKHKKPANKVPGELGEPVETRGGRKIYRNNRVKFIITKRGDNFVKLMKKLDMMNWEFYKYNDLPKDAQLEKGQILYLQPKRKKAERGYNFHEVQKGETMHSISQKYAIKLKELYKKNNMKEEESPRVGQKLYLRWDKTEE